MLRIFSLACLVTLLLLAVAPPPAALQAAVDDEYFGLPEDAGRDEVIAYCGACHSMKLVVQQGLTRQVWAELLVWMYEEQEMAPLEPREEKLVLDYLAEHLGPEGQKQRLRERGVLR